MQSVQQVLFNELQQPMHQMMEVNFINNVVHPQFNQIQPTYQMTQMNYVNIILLIIIIKCNQTMYTKNNFSIMHVKLVLIIILQTTTLSLFIKLI